MSNSMKLPKVMLVLTVLLQLIPFWWKYLLGLFLFNLKGFGLDYSAAESFSIVLLALSFIVFTGVSVGNYSYAKKHKDYKTSILYILNWVLIAVMTYIAVFTTILEIMMAPLNNF